MQKEPHEIDESILNRISEREIAEWMLAKLKQLNEEIRATSFSIDSYTHGKGEYVWSVWHIGASGGHAFSNDSAEYCKREIMKKLLGGSESLVEEKKKQAEKLLSEAKEIESLMAEGVN